MRATMPLLALAAGALLAVPAAAQQRKAADRYRWLKPSTRVTEDLRHVPLAPGPTGPNGSIVLVGGRVFDGTGAPVRDATVVIERDHITKLLAPASKDWPKGARVIDVGGETVMPGMIDLHTHLTYTDKGVPQGYAVNEGDAALRGMERLRYYIESGITSVRDVASLGLVPFRLKAWVQENRIPGPRVFPVGQLITGLGGHGAEGMELGSPLEGSIRIANGPDDWRLGVREQFERGADWIKIASHFSKAEVEAAVSEAHDLGLKVTCDCETFYIQRAVEAGVDMIEHPLPRTDSTIALMAEKGTMADPTLVPYMLIFDQEGGYWGSTSRRFTFSKAADMDVLKRMKAAGIPLGIGTDLVYDWFRFLPWPYITELKQFVAAGYTVPEALETATKTNAELLGMGDRLGTLEPGKLADVVVIKGRPDQNLDDLARVDLVIRDGYVVVQDGRVFIARHTPVPMPKPRPDTD